MNLCAVNFLFTILTSFILLANVTVFASGSIQGHVKDKITGAPLVGANMTLLSESQVKTTDSSGEFFFSDITDGQHDIAISFVGYRSDTLEVQVVAGQTATVQFRLDKTHYDLGNIIVYGASRHQERETEAPAAISSVRAETIRRLASTGQVPRVLDDLPGIDVVQNGITDYSVSTRGFNTVVNRRVLVLLDNRDVAIPLAGYVEWNAFGQPLGDFGQIEFIRGPGSALYGANAFSGVINITTRAPHEIVGTKMTLTGGEKKSSAVDIRHADVRGPWGYKLNMGQSRSETWDKSRNMTTEEITANEYEGLPSEALPLDSDDLVFSYSSARVDYLARDKYTVTAEAGFSQADNTVYMTGVSRYQADRVDRPYARAAFTSDNYFFQVHYTARKTRDKHEIELVSGSIAKEDSRDIEMISRVNLSALEERLHLVLGASHRFRHVDDGMTILTDVYDETFSGAFAHLDYRFAETVKLVGAARVDGSSVHKTQFSPKLGLVYSPSADHSVRATMSRAFLTPSFVQWFFYLPLGDPIDLAPLETEIKATIEDDLGLPPGSVDLPLNFGNTPILVLGNPNLDVEKITGYEIGYKGMIGKKAFVTADIYYNQLKDFITTAAPGVNPNYPTYEVPGTIDPDYRPYVEDALNETFGTDYTAFTTLSDGSHAVVYSVGNASKVDEWGLELGLSYYVTDELRVSGSYTYFDFDVKDASAGVATNLSPNTPEHKFKLGLEYHKGEKLDASVHVRHVDRFQWMAGIFRGDVPSYTLVDLSGGYQLGRNLRLNFVVTNLLDHEHFQLFGGSLIGRRAIGSITVDF